MRKTDGRAMCSSIWAMQDAIILTAEYGRCYFVGSYKDLLPNSRPECKVTRLIQSRMSFGSHNVFFILSYYLSKYANHFCLYININLSRNLLNFNIYLQIIKFQWPYLILWETLSVSASKHNNLELMQRWLWMIGIRSLAGTIVICKMSQVSSGAFSFCSKG